jgi:hypothetical protein
VRQIGVGFEVLIHFSLGALTKYGSVSSQ